MNSLGLTTVGGYFGVCFLFVANILVVYSGLLGIVFLDDEERDHATEFLYIIICSEQSLYYTARRELVTQRRQDLHVRDACARPEMTDILGISINQL